MNAKHFLILKKLILLTSFACWVCLLCGCDLNKNNIFSYEQKSINDCIRNQNKNYTDIYELTCIPGNDTTLLGSDYDLLGELVNLEKIKFVGIADESDAQKFFSELSGLKKLNTVEIEDSKVGMIDKLGEITNLNSLSIIGNSGGGDWFTIKDLNLLGTDSRFNKLQSLTLKYINMETIPNLSELTNLQELSISGYDINRIDADVVNWENLTSLKISNTSVTVLDNSIVDRLNNLQLLDISHTFIRDVNFVLNLPNLKSFLYANHSFQNVDMECLKNHPNYAEKWSVN
ncbi:MAG: hypothetical protein J6A89_04970 [Clostridia bacterium]|nr:hypothetical protein [Clostridia bacterium]